MHNVGEASPPTDLDCSDGIVEGHNIAPAPDSGQGKPPRPSTDIEDSPRDELHSCSFDFGESFHPSEVRIDRSENLHETVVPFDHVSAITASEVLKKRLAECITGIHSMILPRVASEY
jgi:hypothetical protein